MIDHFLGDALGVLSCQFWSTVLQSAAAHVLPCSAAATHLKLLDRAVSGARFLTGGVFECNIALLSVDPWQSFVCFIRPGVTRCNPCSTWTVCASAGDTRFSGRTSVHLCTATLQNIAVLHDFYSPIGVLLERSC